MHACDISVFVLACRTPTLTLQARAAAIAIIVIQTIAFLAFGWALWPVWLASLLAWIMGGIQLCMFTKCCYIAAGICYIFGLISNLVGVAFW